MGDTESGSWGSGQLGGFERREEARVEFVTNNLKREMVIRPAYDKRPKYGIHGVEMAWYVRGAKGVIQFLLYTNWFLPEVQEELDAKPRSDPRFTHLSCHPMPADIGYHSPKPMYDGQEMFSEECVILGGVCYYDGSGLNAKRFYDLMVREGGEALWLALEQEYREIFEREAAIAS